MTVLTRFFKKWAGLLVIFALTLCVCTDIPDFCGNGGQYDPATQFCVGDNAFNKCGGDVYDPLTYKCESGSVTPITPPITTYDVTILGGTSAAGTDTGSYSAGTMVFIIAGTPPTGKRFAAWTTESSGVTFADANNRITMFAMPANAVTVTANFETVPVYAVTVSGVGTGATGSGSYTVGDTVTVMSGIAPAGQQFKNWTSTPSVTFADENNLITTFIMPANAVTVTANFEPIPIHAVTVESVGSNPLGVGNYRVGTTVTVWAGVAPAGYEFVNWTADPAVSFDNANSAITAFVMPNAPVTVTANFEPLPTAYTVTYNGNGHNGGSVPIDTTQYFGGAAVIVLGVGDLKRTNHAFSGWNTAADGSGISYSAGNAFHIADNIILYARWTLESIPTYMVTVSGGTGSGSYEQGAAVSITAGTPPSGQRFANWTTTSAGVTFGDANNPSTSFAMPANEVTVTANFEAIPTYEVTVSGGTDLTGGSHYIAGTTVVITADTPPSGQRFLNWTATPAVTFINANSATTTFSMPANDVTVTANFENIPTYNVAVSGGIGATGGGSYVQGATVTITTGTPPAGQRFVNWTTTSSGVTFANANSAATFFVMPANAVAVTANFEAAFTDPRDGQTYRTVLMPDNKVWMAQNLNYRDSTWSHNDVTDSLPWVGGGILGSWCYGNNASNCNIYGRLYTWDAAMQACPTGWRLPALDDWRGLFQAVGGVRNGDCWLSAGHALKSSPPSWDGANAHGFSALPGGFGWFGSFLDLGNWSSWWNATVGNADFAWYVNMGTGYTDVDEGVSNKSDGYSVRCVRND